MFLSDGHINFAFLNYPSDEAADMVGGASYEGLHHMGFQVDDLEEAKVRLAGTEAELLGDAVGSHHSFYFEQKVRGPHGVIMDMSTNGWDLEPPEAAPAEEERSLKVQANRRPASGQTPVAFKASATVCIASSVSSSEGQRG